MSRVALSAGLASLLAFAPFTGDLLALPSLPGPRFDAGFAEALEAHPGALADALVSVHGQATRAHAERLDALGLRVLRVYGDFGVLYVAGTGVDLLKLRSEPGVAYVAANRELASHLATATVATRARDAWDAKSTSTPMTVDGRVVDGRGIGIAIVDSGIAGDHPDFAGALGASKKWACSTPFLSESSSGYGKCFGDWALSGNDESCQDPAWKDLVASDDVGHGTHVAGIAAGRGTMSGGRFAGVAPGATLYALGANVGVSVVFAVEGLEWVRCHHATVSPPIRVVSNSWGGNGDFDPDAPVNRAVDALVAEGIVVTFSAGNDGGDGDSDNYSLWAKNPTPGVLGVASYNDGGLGTRTGTLSGFSSRGDSSATDANLWPDLSAPGDGITSTWGKPSAYVGPPTELSYLPYYTVASGTSMSAPHVAGVAALLFQANASLTPALVEDILEDTARRFPVVGGYVPDATNPDNGGVNYGAGHGLVDALAALRDPRVGAAGGSALPQTSQSPHVYVGAADGQLVGGVQWTVPRGQPVQLSERTLRSGDLAVWGLAENQPAAFRLGGVGNPRVLPALLRADGSAVQMSVTTTFTQPGTYTVEPQIDFGAGLVSFDSFAVRVV